jgi:hypothetical protein
MRRRDFLWVIGGTSVACSIGCSEPAGPRTSGGDAGPTSPVDANSGVDACAQAVVRMHDTYAQALYLDGTNGPLTGVITVAYVAAGTAIMLDFWHGHGGQLHRFMLDPEHFEALKQGQRVTVGTTTVENHAHTLFIDPLDEDYRVPGAPDVDVPLRCEV